MLRYLADLWEPWEDPRVEVEHLLDCGEHVVMLGRTTGKGRLSGMDVVGEVAGAVDSSPGDGRDPTGRAARGG